MTTRNDTTEAERRLDDCLDSVSQSLNNGFNPTPAENHALLTLMWVQLRQQSKRIAALEARESAQSVVRHTRVPDPGSASSSPLSGIGIESLTFLVTPPRATLDDPGKWVAHCLDFDVACCGDSPLEAITMATQATEETFSKGQNNFGLAPQPRSCAAPSFWLKAIKGQR